MKTPFLRMIIAIGVALEVSVVLGDPNSLKLEISVKAAGENGAPQSQDSDNISFDQFVQKYSKRYTSSEEYEKRKAIFEENMVKAKRQNRDGTSDAVFGVTSLSDMTDEEFFKFKNSLKRNDWESSFWDSKKIFSHSGSRLPERIDWREKGCVSSVKLQHAQNCWSYATATAVEGAFCKANGTVQSLSTQQQNDCMDDRCPYSCDKGCWVRIGLELVRSQGGLMTEKDYPTEKFHPQCNKECKFDPLKIAAPLHDHGKVDENEESVKAALVEYGPLGIGVCTDGLRSGYQNYKGGATHIIQGCSEDCSINHAVGLVGYDSLMKDGQRMDYWIIKNSWGPDWGDQGFFKVLRNNSNMCHVNNKANWALSGRSGTTDSRSRIVPGK